MCVLHVVEPAEQTLHAVRATDKPLETCTAWGCVQLPQF